MLRLVFFGSDEIALPVLEFIATVRPAEAEVVAVVSQPDRPSGRGQKLQPNAIVLWARERNIPVFQPEKPGPETTETLRNLGFDAALVMAYGHILKRDLLAVPPLGFFNIHASLLPRLRGATPIEGAIATSLGETGVSLQRVVPQLDAGPVVDSEIIPLAPDETRHSLREKVAVAGVPLVARALPRIAAGDAAGIPQDEAQVTFTRKITREDSGVDFRASAQEIAARVRALTPWPGVTLPYGDIVLKIGDAEVVSISSVPGSEKSDSGTGNSANAATLVSTDIVPGTLLSATSAGVDILTGDGVLRLRQLQRPGGKMLPVSAFLSGFPLPAGFVFESWAMPALVRGA
jgi:methionyl-tRNA formyltransferase